MPIGGAGTKNEAVYSPPLSSVARVDKTVLPAGSAIPSSRVYSVTAAPVTGMPPSVTRKRTAMLNPVLEGSAVAPANSTLLGRASCNAMVISLIRVRIRSRSCAGLRPSIALLRLGELASSIEAIGPAAVLAKLPHKFVRIRCVCRERRRRVGLPVYLHAAGERGKNIFPRIDVLQHRDRR